MLQFKKDYLLRDVTNIIPNKNNIIFYCIFSIIYIFPLLLTNSYYIDDINRSIYGYGWNHDGRYIATKILQFISSGKDFIDFHPYSIILAALILALSGYYISIILDLEKSSKIKFSGILLLISPLMLENISYRWDSLPMAISIISVIFPFLYLKRPSYFVIISFVGIITSIFTYQASVAIYGLLALCLIISNSLKSNFKNVLQIIKLCSIALILSFLAYKAITLLLNSTYQGRNLTIFASSDIITLLKANIDGTYKLIQTVFNTSYSLMYIVAISIFSFAYVKFLFSKTKLIYKLLLSASIVLIPLGITLILIVQKSSWFVPRVLVGFPFVIYLFLILIDSINSKLTKYISIGFIIISLPLMTSYSNALQNQRKFEYAIINDIQPTLAVNDKAIIFNGNEPWAPEVKIASNNYPILNYLVPKYLDNNWVWTTYLISKEKYTNKKYTNTNEYEKIINNILMYPIKSQNDHYYIRENDSVIIVDFDKR